MTSHDTTIDGRPAFPDAPAGGLPERHGIDWFAVFGRFSPLIFLALLMTAFALLEPRFLTPQNLFNVMRQVSIYGTIAVGMNFVMFFGLIVV